MMERILPSKSGPPTALVGSRYLLSAYDPRREARRFAENLSMPRPPSTILIIGECLGYAAEAFREKYPSALVLSAYCSPFFYDGRIDPRPEDEKTCWRPGGKESFLAFLGRNIGDADFSGLRVLSWEPAFDAYPEPMDRLLREAARFGREVNGTLLTTRVFGKRWIKNALRNFLRTDAPLFLERCSGPVLVAASGPGLHSALPLIRKFRGRFSLFALPSALDFLAFHDIEPDAAVLTDPGFYAGLHFRSALRRPGRKKTPLLLPLTAFAGHRQDAFPPALFDQGSAVEKHLYEPLTVKPLSLPPNGTVAGSASAIALASTESPVFIAGLDLCARDVVEHARPNAFDPLSENDSRRSAPEESLRFARMINLYPQKIRGGLRVSAALKTYAGWFAGRKFSRVFRVAPSPVDIGVPEAGYEAFESLPEAGTVLRFAPMDFPAEGERRRIAGDFLDRLEEEIESLRPFADGPSSLSDVYLMIDTEAVLRLLRNADARESAALLARVRLGVHDFVRGVRPLLRSGL